MKRYYTIISRKNAFLIGVFSAALSALTLNSFTQVELELFTDGFTRPVAIANAGDNRLFIVEQAGRISIVDSTGKTNEQPFLDIRDKIKSTGNEQGLLGLAFHPEYKSNGLFYVNYTNLSGSTVISRFACHWSNPDSALSDSEFTILSFDQPYSNHNGGDLKFGPDGYLYIASGDGGNRGDPENRAQNPDELLGKMLRIDVDGGSPYAIPESNPFTDSATVLDEIWAMGLRNPWRFSFDRETGDLWIGDVGQGEWEEINFQVADSKGGENYGWRCYEGTESYNLTDCPDANSFVLPVYAYDHGPTGGCSVTGGYVYRGNDFPSLTGYYFFTDYCTNRLVSLHDSAGNWVGSEYDEYPNEGFSTFGENYTGELFIAGLNSGKVYRIKSADALSSISYGSNFVNENNAGLNIYPNPVHDHIWIESNFEESSNPRIAIYTLDGELVYTSQSTENRTRIDLDFLPNGMYFLELGSKTQTENRKILKY